jgi:hypothetical protein
MTKKCRNSFLQQVLNGKDFVSFVSFSDQVQPFLASQEAVAHPPLKKAIDAALQIFSQTNAEELSPKQSLQCMRKISSCFKNHPDVRKHVQKIRHTELEKMKQVKEKVLPEKRPAREIEEPPAKRRKQEEVSRKRVRESAGEEGGQKNLV